MRRSSIVLVVSLLATIVAHAADTLAITFAGDLLLDRGVRRLIEQRGADALFTPQIDSVFRTSHLVVCNLECPATSIKAPILKRYIFRGEPEWLTTLKAHGITHLNLANNHSVDQGRSGLMDTRRNVSLAGMVPVGADSTIALAAQPVLLSEEPRRVWLLVSNRLTLENFAYLPHQPNVSQEPIDTLLRRVAHLRQESRDSYIIVCLHWGAEHQLTPVPQQREQARQLIDAGADILICHHTHTLQTIETYRGHPIYYSIGNFIFDQTKPLNTRAAMVQLKITKDTTQTKTIPIEIRNCVPFISDTH